MVVVAAAGEACRGLEVARRAGGGEFLCSMLVGREKRVWHLGGRHSRGELLSGWQV